MFTIYFWSKNMFRLSIAITIFPVSLQDHTVNMCMNQQIHFVSGCLYMISAHYDLIYVYRKLKMWQMSTRKRGWKKKKTLPKATIQEDGTGPSNTNSLDNPCYYAGKNISCSIDVAISVTNICCYKSITQQVLYRDSPDFKFRISTALEVALWNSNQGAELTLY